MKIARFSTGDELRYGIIEGLPANEPYPSGESEGHLVVLRDDPLCTPPEATSEIVPLDAVKTTIFNGIQHPSMAILREDGTLDMLRAFTYEDYKSRMS